MDKVTTQKMTIERRWHDFSCDICGKKIAEVLESSDGYVKDPGEFEMRYYVDNVGWFQFEKCLCDDCKEKVKQQFVDTLINFGFKEDRL